MKKIFFIFATVLTFNFQLLTFNCVAQWHQTNGPDSVTISCIAISGNYIFAGTNNGVYLSKNNGNNWVKINSGLTDYNINALAINDTNIFAGTGSAGVFLSSINNNNWTAVNSGLTTNWVTALAIKDDIIIAGTFGDNVYLSANNGQLWTEKDNGLPILSEFISAFAINGNTIYAGLSSCGVYKTIDDGKNWTITGLKNPDIYSLATSGSNIFAGSDSGRIFLSTDNGNNWSLVNNGLPSNALISAFAISGDKIFAGTVYGVFFSSNNGNSWVAVNNGFPSNTAFENTLAIKGDTLFAGNGGAGVWMLPLEGLGIKEINDEINLAVYPNPTKNNITIDVSATLNIPATIEITNIQGQLIETLAAKSNKTNIDVSALPGGVYIVEVKTEKGVVVKKFIKQ